MKRSALLLALVFGLGAGIAPAALTKRPDLELSSITISGDLRVGGTITIAGTHANRGKARARRSTTRYVLSADRRADAGDTLLATKRLRKVKKGKRRAHRLVTSLPAAGAFVVGCADATKKLRERREGNNCRAVPVSVAVPPDPTPTPEPTPTPTPEPDPPASLSIADAQGDEGTSVRFGLALSKPRSTDTVVPYVTAPGTADGGLLGGNDYSHEDDTITIPAGETAAEISIGIVGDSEVEADETFTVALTAPEGVELADGSAVGTIIDDDVFRVSHAISIDSDTVRVFFTDTLDASTVASNGSQFVTDPSLAVTAASVSSDTVFLQTAPQAPGVQYTLTVDAAGIESSSGIPLDDADTSVTFSGHSGRVVLNEIAPNITGAEDLIELRATSPGPLDGLQLVDRSSTTTVTFGDLDGLTVAEGDIVVVHLGDATTATSETSSKTQCSVAACYAGAWDVRGTTSSIAYSSRVIEILRGTAVMDTGVFTTGSDGPVNFASRTDASMDIGQWGPPCPTSPCTLEEAKAAAASWLNVGTTTTGDTVRRTTTTDTNTKNDWAVGAHSLGAP